jgi:hypothetical protein
MSEKIEFSTPDQKLIVLNHVAKTIQNQFQKEFPEKQWKVQSLVEYSRFAISSSFNEQQFKVFADDRFVQYYKAPMHFLNYIGLSIKEQYESENG